MALAAGRIAPESQALRRTAGATSADKVSLLSLGSPTSPSAPRDQPAG
ncbi:hypothetical protein ADP8_05218 [Roseomonas mucosa]|nr:hypothetical protein ADP8_05218 [Roseomonas mucosa]